MFRTIKKLLSKYLYVLAFIIVGSFLFSLGLAQVSTFENKTSFGEIALKESVVPIHAVAPGKPIFWNENAHQFIYAPAFNYKAVKDASKYKYKIFSLRDSSSYSFESPIPYSSLGKVWASVPVGLFDLLVTGISANGDSVGLAGKGQYYRAALFNGIYHKAVIPYDKSAMIALDSLMHKSYVSYWLTNKAPDPSYDLYKLPAKIISALIIGAVTHANLNSTERKRSTEIARITADYLIGISFKAGSLWEYFPPTYYGETFKNPDSHMQLSNNFTIMGVDAGNAYLDLYDLTKDEKYLLAAKRIAYTYLKTQLPNGSWHLFVNHETGKPVAENITIPTSLINYFDRLGKDYKINGLEASTKSALNWLMTNPVKTFNWQGQFEDMKGREPYKNQSREQACELAVYLFKNKQQINVAEELIRYAEDQFVIWEQPKNYVRTGNGPSKRPSPGWNSKYWITPCVLEQYTYWMPVTRSAGIMIETYWHAYAATEKEIYLAKAKSIANALTLVQKENGGNYPGYFTKYPMQEWINGIVYPAKVMRSLANNLK